MICGRNLYKQGENEIRDTKRQDKEKKRKEEKGERERAIKKLPHHIIKKLTMNTQERKKTVLELDGRGGGTLFSLSLSLSLSLTLTLDLASPHLTSRHFTFSPQVVLDNVHNANDTHAFPRHVNAHNASTASAHHSRQHHINAVRNVACHEHLHG